MTQKHVEANQRKWDKEMIELIKDIFSLCKSRIKEPSKTLSKLKAERDSTNAAYQAAYIVGCNAFKAMNNARTAYEKSLEQKLAKLS